VTKLQQHATLENLVGVGTIMMCSSICAVVPCLLH